MLKDLQRYPPQACVLPTCQSCGTTWHPRSQPQCLTCASITRCRYSGDALRPLPVRRPVDAGAQAQASQQVRPALNAGAALWILARSLRPLACCESVWKCYTWRWLPSSCMLHRKRRPDLDRMFVSYGGLPCICSTDLEDHVCHCGCQPASACTTLLIAGALLNLPLPGCPRICA